MLDVDNGWLRVLVGLSLGLYGLAAPAQPEEVQCESTPTLATEYVPGWYCVDIDLDPAYVDAHRGEFADSVGEYVGGLLDQGLEVDKSMWLKPGYGNENLLWTLNYELTEKRLDKALAQADKFPRNETLSGTIKIDGVEWRYVGYSTQPVEKGKDPFRSFMYLCRDSERGVGVYYWGELNEAFSLDDYGPVKTLLAQLNRYCQSDSGK